MLLIRFNTDMNIKMHVYLHLQYVTVLTLVIKNTKNSV